MISREQIKAGRAMLDWSQKELAEHSGVSEATVKLIETARINSTPETRQTIQDALEKGGLEFLPQNGVRMRDDLLTILEKKDEDDNVFLRLLDDIYYTMRKGYGEVLWSFVDDSLSPPEVIEKEKLIRSTGCTIRSLVRYGDTYLPYPLEEYRYLPKGMYLTNPTVIYGDKFALMINKDFRDGKGNKSVIIINNRAVSELKRTEFEIIWAYGDAPSNPTEIKR